MRMVPMVVAVVVAAVVAVVARGHRVATQTMAVADEAMATAMATTQAEATAEARVAMRAKATRSQWTTRPATSVHAPRKIATAQVADMVVVTGVDIAAVITAARLLIWEAALPSPRVLRKGVSPTRCAPVLT